VLGRIVAKVPSGSAIQAPKSFEIVGIEKATNQNTNPSKSHDKNDHTINLIIVFLFDVCSRAKKIFDSSLEISNPIRGSIRHKIELILNVIGLMRLGKSKSAKIKMTQATRKFLPTPTILVDSKTSSPSVDQVTVLQVRK
jgi:hypothetical protein